MQITEAAVLCPPALRLYILKHCKRTFLVISPHPFWPGDECSFSQDAFVFLKLTQCSGRSHTWSAVFRSTPHPSFQKHHFPYCFLKVQWEWTLTCTSWALASNDRAMTTPSFLHGIFCSAGVNLVQCQPLHRFPWTELWTYWNSLNWQEIVQGWAVFFGLLANQDVTDQWETGLGNPHLSQLTELAHSLTLSHMLERLCDYIFVFL